MKTLIKNLGLAVALAFAIFAQQARAQDAPAAQGDTSVSFQTFYDQLAGQGSWINTDQYGYVFQPNETDPNWRPYAYGHWVNTDAGMTWVSDESFGWATYHYGRWANIDGTGWVWVPGYTWAPAWVSWRDGDDEVGWAPLPPDSDQGIDYYSSDDYYTDPGYAGFHIGGDCDVAYGIGPLWYNFCPVVYIGDRDCWRHFRNYNDNFAFIGRTRNVTNINFRRDGGGRFGHVHAEGPNVASLNTRSRNPIERAQLASVSRANEAGLHGNRLGVFAPRVDPATFRTARPNSVNRTFANTNLNRGTDINHPPRVNSQLAGTHPTAEQINAANVAQHNVPNGARVDTASTRIGHPLTQPLGSMRTTTRSAAITGNNFAPNNANAVNRHATSSASFDSRYAGQPAVPHASMSSNRESRVGAESAYTGQGFHQQPVAPGQATSNFRRNDSAFAPQVSHTSAPSFQRSAPVVQSNAPAFHPQQNFQRSEPAFHASAPSFHAAAPAPTPHFNGGGFNGGGGFHGGGAPAPAAHSGGGGQVSSGGGHASANGQAGHR
jgi:hypothetical protein